MYIGDWVRAKHVRRSLHDGEGYCLDVGCGRGLYREICESKGYEWVGIDIKKEKFPNFILASAVHLPFKDACFSACLVVDVLEHLQDDLQCLKEIYGILRRGSQLVVHVPKWPQKHFFGETPLHPSHIRQGYTHQEIYQLIRQAGFMKIHIEMTFRTFEALAWDMIYFRLVTFSAHQIADLEDELHKGAGWYGHLVVAQR